MKLTIKTADKIAKRYDAERDWTGKTPLDKALAEVIRRHGGLCAALNEDARRDLILTLGDHRRDNERARTRSRAVFASAQARLERRDAAE